jgi:hypothetical protein
MCHSCDSDCEDVAAALWDVMSHSSVNRYKYFEKSTVSAFMVEEIATWGENGLC